MKNRSPHGTRLPTFLHTILLPRYASVGSNIGRHRILFNPAVPPRVHSAIAHSASASLRVPFCQYLCHSANLPVPFCPSQPPRHATRDTRPTPTLTWLRGDVPSDAANLPSWHTTKHHQAHGTSTTAGTQLYGYGPLFSLSF